ncbi:hypothetical protein XarbCFBP8138_17000 [Xanthomonas arboricola]|uniref:hypothetical protein n=1 Tax=Xanthomonas arboricola TaxID=56448 RepID=UPI000D4CC062|nr:hypothetical protein XarbCFBP8138_17000 [Xanthomonas arboricola]
MGITGKASSRVSALLRQRFFVYDDIVAHCLFDAMQATRKDRWEDDCASWLAIFIANPLRAGLVERFGDYLFWDAIWLP